jgi:NAD(P)-dependent dehydrogenase (short-subunit alcohol dehydrogenase family)
MKNYFVIGASRGLGAALVEELLSQGAHRVFGIARTKFKNVHDYKKLVCSKQYQYRELDITANQCIEYLKNTCSQLSPEPVYIFFNAAHVGTDLNSDNSFDYDSFNKINEIGISGFGNVLQACQNHLLTYGGALIGISSFSALAPPVFGKRIAYPASKAYLDMALRSLNIVWRKKVKVVTVHLGHIGGRGNGIINRLIQPSYKMTAKKIIRSLSRSNVPRTIDYPFIYFLTYRVVFSFISDAAYLSLFNLLFKLKRLVRFVK